mmetsp:Transcript_47492/g.138467  ORF Transcript_47492/g.138467 Transcript_47492/m.138467 type:complete len:82 (+) Transcript_47492:160-405(+)
MFHGKDIIFNTSNLCQYYINMRQVDLTSMIGDVIAERRQYPLVNIEKKVECTHSNIQTGKVRQEVIPNKETQEYNIINKSL